MLWLITIPVAVWVADELLSAEEPVRPADPPPTPEQVAAAFAAAGEPDPFLGS